MNQATYLGSKPWAYCGPNPIEHYLRSQVKGQ